MPDLQIKFEFDGESWEQIVPPSKGKLGPLSLTAAVQDGDGPEDSRVTLSASLKSMQQTLEQMEVTVSRPSTFEVVLNGINAQALADVLLDRGDHRVLAEPPQILTNGLGVRGYGLRASG